MIVSFPRKPASALLIILGSLIGTSAASANEGGAHEHAVVVASAPATKASPMRKVPVTAAGIWQLVDQETAELDRLIQRGQLDQVHHHAFAIRDLVTNLPMHAQARTPAQLARINSNVKFVTTLAERLDATGDAKDKAGTQANLAKLKQVLANLRAEFASEVK